MGDITQTLAAAVVGRRDAPAAVCTEHHAEDRVSPKGTWWRSALIDELGAQQPLITIRDRAPHS